MLALSNGNGNSPYHPMEDVVCAPARGGQPPPDVPHNTSAEQATLGSVLLNREAMIAIAPWLRPEYFYLERHTLIYDAMLTCYNKRIPPDTRMVPEELRRRGQLDAVGGIPYLTDLVEGVPTSYHVEHYAKIVERTALLRQLIGAGGKIAALGYEEQTELDATLDKAEAVLFAISQRRSTQDFVPIGQVFEGLFEKFVVMQENRGEVAGISTGFRDLDYLTGGLHPTDLIILAARPSVGKSALALGMAYQIAKEDKVVGVFSLEMGREQLALRLLAMHTGLDMHKLRNGYISDMELQLAIQAMSELSGLPIFIEDTVGLNSLELRSKARRLQAMRGLDLLIVDYLQLIQGRRNENRVQEVSEISRSLKALARELRIPLVALSQLSRAVEGRTSHVPMLSDLRESGQIEADADGVWFIHREELYDRQTDKLGIAEIHIAKQRNGPLGIVPLRFDAATTQFQNLAYRDVSGY